MVRPRLRRLDNLSRRNKELGYAQIFENCGIESIHDSLVWNSIAFPFLGTGISLETRSINRCLAAGRFFSHICQFNS